MVMCVAVSMTSCSKEDSKDEPIITREPITVYNATLTNELLTYFDFKLELSNESKKMEITLAENNCTAAAGLLRDWEFIEIDGVPGITSVKAEVTPKADIEKLLAETMGAIMVAAKPTILKAVYNPSTKTYETEPARNTVVIIPMEPALWLLDAPEGKKTYDYWAEFAAKDLTME